MGEQEMLTEFPNDNQVIEAAEQLTAAIKLRVSLSNKFDSLDRDKRTTEEWAKLQSDFDKVVDNEAKLAKEFVPLLIRYFFDEHNEMTSIIADELARMLRKK